MQLTFSIVWVWRLKMGPKSSKKKKKMVRKCTNTKSGITRVWNELQPKLFHQQLDTNKGAFEKVMLN